MEGADRSIQEHRLLILRQRRHHRRPFHDRRAAGQEELEEMAKYSKQLWPNLPTVVRATPSKISWSGTYKYLDAAWAQVENVRGDLKIQDFLDQNVAGARKLGLALVVGLNT